MKITSIVVILFFLCGTSISFAQTVRETEWNQVQSTAAIAFKIKEQEEGLKGQLLRNKLFQRCKAFRKAAIELNSWIEKYYPNGGDAPTTGYVLAKFKLALYVEYTGSYKSCTDMYLEITEFLVVLYHTNQSIPKYNGSGVDQWISKKLKTLNQINNELDSRVDEFGFEMLQSAETIEEYTAKRLDFLIEDRRFSDFVSGDSDELFAFNEFILGYVDSIAPTNFGLWCSIYFNELFGGLKIKYEKDSMSNFQLWVVGDSNTISKNISEKLNSMSIDFSKRYCVSDSIHSMSILLQTDNARKKLDQTQLALIFGEPRGDGINYIQVERWHQRMFYLNESIHSSEDTLVDEVYLTSIINWILDDYGKHPPNWLSGLAYLYSDGSTFTNRTDSKHLYYLKAVLMHNKLPRIEEIISSSNTLNEYSSIYNFKIAYYRYFCWFLEQKGILPIVYKKLQNSPNVTDESSIELIQRMSGIDLNDLNKGFKEFIISRDIDNIPTRWRHSQNPIEEYTIKLLFR